MHVCVCEYYLKSENCACKSQQQQQYQQNVYETHKLHSQKGAQKSPTSSRRRPLRRRCRLSHSLQQRALHKIVIVVVVIIVSVSVSVFVSLCCCRCFSGCIKRQIVSWDQHTHTHMHAHTLRETHAHKHRKCVDLATQPAAAADSAAAPAAPSTVLLFKFTKVNETQTPTSQLQSQSA